MHSTSLIKLISYLYILTFLNGNLSHASFPGITLNVKQRSLVMRKSLKIPFFFSLLVSSDRLWQWGQRQGSIPMWTNRLVTEKIFSENHCHPSSRSWKYALLSKRETGSTSKTDLVQIIITTRKAKSHETWDQQDYLFVYTYYGEKWCTTAFILFYKYFRNNESMIWTKSQLGIVTKWQYLRVLLLCHSGSNLHFS